MKPVYLDTTVSLTTRLFNAEKKVMRARQVLAEHGQGRQAFAALAAAYSTRAAVMEDIAAFQSKMQWDGIHSAAATMAITDAHSRDMYTDKLED